MILPTCKPRDTISHSVASSSLGIGRGREWVDRTRRYAPLPVLLGQVLGNAERACLAAAGEQAGAYTALTSFLAEGESDVR